MARAPYYRFGLRIHKTQSDAWRAAADREHMTYRDWAMRELDRASIPPEQEPDPGVVLEQQRMAQRTQGHPKICGCRDGQADG